MRNYHGWLPIILILVFFALIFLLGLMLTAPTPNDKYKNENAIELVEYNTNVGATIIEVQGDYYLVSHYGGIIKIEYIPNQINNEN